MAPEETDKFTDDSVTKPDDRRHPTNFDRIYKTICIYVCFFVLGFGEPMIGTTAVHLEYLFGIDTATMAWSFTGHCVGYLIGSFLCGFVYDRVNHELLFAVANAFQGLATIVAGFFNSIYPFIFFIVLQGVSQGFVDAGGQSYGVSLWMGHRFKEPVMQALHAVWSCGAMIGPFIIGAFLVDLKKIDTNNTNIVNISYENDINTTGPVTADMEHSVGMVRFAYVTIGALITVASGLFVVAYCRDRSTRRALKRQETQPDTDSAPAQSSSNPEHRQSRKIFISFELLLFLFYFMHAFVEVVPIAYFPSFAMKYLGWPAHSASLLMSVFFATHFVGRLAGVPLSAVIRPRTMVIINVIMTASAYLLLLFVHLHSAVLWASAAIAGLSMASTFAAVILWTSENIVVTGQVASVFLMGASVGGMVCPLVVGWLFDTVSPMCMVYTLVVSSLGHILLYAIMCVFARKFHSQLKSSTAVVTVVPPSL